MKRLLQHSILIASGVMVSQPLLALGLGELTLHSALNQPLKAEIRLVDRKNLSNSEIQPQLATQSDFDRAGIDRSFFLSGIKFTVESDRILLSSDKPVNEPFLNFLVELNWPQGRTLREYTVLLDPPAFDEENYQQLEVSKPTTGEVVREDYYPGGAVKAEPGRWNNPAKSGQYKVQKNDTLWEIALETRPDRSISPQQMMLAIQQQNPHAFMGGNISRLKSHTVLTLPTEEQLKGITYEDAFAEVAQQNKALKTGAAQIDATGLAKKPASANISQKSGGEVSLLVGKNKQGNAESSSGNTESEQAGVNEALENELAIALEQIDESKRENDELRKRLDSLQEQIDTLTQLVQLKNEQLASMQSGAQQVESNKQLTEEEKRARIAEMLADQDGAEDADLFAQILNEIQQNPAIPAGAAGLLLLLILLALRAKKKKADQEAEQTAATEAPAQTQQVSVEEAKLQELQAAAVGALVANNADDEEDQEVYLDSFDSGDIDESEEEIELEQNLEVEEKHEFDYSDDDDSDSEFNLDDDLASELAEELGLETTSEAESNIASLAATEEIPTLDMEESIDFDTSLSLDDLEQGLYESEESEASGDETLDDEALDVDFSFDLEDATDDVNALEDESLEVETLETLESLDAESEIEAIEESNIDNIENVEFDIDGLDTMEEVAFAEEEQDEILLEVEAELEAETEVDAENEGEAETEIESEQEFAVDFSLDDLEAEVAAIDDQQEAITDENEELESFDLDLDLDTLLQTNEAVAAVSAENDADEESESFAGPDENATKLDLARAYIEMSEADGARELLEEVLEQGNAEQKAEAQELLNSL